MRFDCLRRSVLFLRAWLLRVMLLMALGLGFAGAARADLIVSQLLDTDRIPAGSRITYTVVLRDSVGAARTGVQLNFGFLTTSTTGRYAGVDNLPAGASCAGLAINESIANQAAKKQLTCTGINIPAGGSVEMLVYVDTTVQGQVEVEASLVGGTQSEFQNTTVNAGADLRLAATAPATAAAGSVQSITFTVTNLGPNASPAHTVSYTVPPNFTLTSQAGCRDMDSQRVVLCDGGALAVNASSSITLQGVVGAGNGSTLTHTASVLAGGGVDDSSVSNNTVQPSMAITAGTALALVNATETDSTPIKRGDLFRYVLKGSYSGDFPAGVTMSDTLPSQVCIPNLGNISAPNWNCTVTGNTTCSSPGGGGGAQLNCTIKAGTGPAGSARSLGNITVPVRALETGTITNEARLRQSAFNYVDAQAQVSVVGDGADLSAVKLMTWIKGSSAVPLNQPFSYSLTATNLGPSPLPVGSVITLTDTLPVGLTVTSVQAGGASCDRSGTVVGPATITCTVTTSAVVKVGSSIPQVTLIAKATTSGTTLNNRLCTKLTAVGALKDDVTGNDCVETGVDVHDNTHQADIRVLKRVVGKGQTAADPQDATKPLVWEIEIVNDSKDTPLGAPVESTNIKLTDTFAKALYGQARLLEVFPGVAEMQGCSLSKSGTDIKFNDCSIRRLPPCTAGVNCPRLRVSLFHFVTDGTLTTDGTAYQTFNTLVAAVPQDIADPLRSNNTVENVPGWFKAGVDLKVTKTASSGTGSTQVPAGQLLAYTINVLNPADKSPATVARNVRMTDTLPVGVVLLSPPQPSGNGYCTTAPAVGTATTLGNRTVECVWPSISRSPSGTSTQETVKINVRALAALRGTTITNNVRVESDTPEINTSDNVASVSTLITDPVYDVLVDNTDNVDPMATGELVTYSVKVSNNAASAAEDLTLRITFNTLNSPLQSPQFVEVVQPLPSGVRCSVTTQVVCSIDALGGNSTNPLYASPEESSKTVQLRMRGRDVGSFRTTAVVGFASPTLAAFEPVSLRGNNTEHENTTVVLFKTDVEVLAKTAVRRGAANDSQPLATVGAGTGFDWLVRLRNNGPSDAMDTHFVDTLPAGMVLDGTAALTITSSGPVFVPGTPSCTAVTASGLVTVECVMSTMPKDGTATVRIPVRLSGSPATGRVFTNTATLTTNGTSDTNSSNNAKTTSVTVGAGLIAGVVFHDLNRNGTKEDNEPGIATTINLSGSASATTTSDPVTGAWSFGVAAGTYTVTEVQPATYLPGTTYKTSNSLPGSVPGGSRGNAFTGIVVADGETRSGYYFGEERPTVTARVFEDGNNDGVPATGDAGIADVVLTITGTDAQGNAVAATATPTAQPGRYTFGALPLSDAAGYTIRQTQPAGYLPGKASVGTFPGNALDGGNVVTGVVLSGSLPVRDVGDYNFGEIKPAAAAVTVRVFEDANNSGTPDTGDAGIANVVLHLTGTSAAGEAVDITATAIANQTGRYRFANVPPSDATGYTITEQQPAGY
ncbi:SdrD B-like domain-containing protein, partial [Azohydromonas lata]|uniref:SdrD B-like domain-containing protein n=1 Tax=Azohydromonas lata TaxID=45677 RepID=UPI000B1DF5FB